jgi:Skp family chaperone for outer membrane proteins
MTNISLNRRSHSLPIIGLALTLLCTSFTAINASAAAAQSSPTFGSVDVQKVLAGATKKAALDQQLTDLSNKLEAQFKQQVASPMLSAANQQELGTLLSKSNPTDADKARITELQAMSQKDADELASLQQVKSPTDAQTARLGVLTKEQQDSQEIFQNIADGYKAQVQAASDKNNLQLSDALKQAIAAVAQQKGLAVVFDSNVALYTSNDITEDVTKRFNK